MIDVNPLHPNISINILLTLLHTSPLVLTGDLFHQSKLLNLVTSSFFLVMLINDSAELL